MSLMDIQPNIIDPTLETKMFWFYGEPGTRKTSVAACFPKHLIFATEKGYKFINGAMAQPVNNWNELRRFYRELKDDAVKERFTTIVFDRIDTLYEYCYDYVLKQLGVDDLSQAGYGKGWKTLKKEFNSIIKGIENLGYGMIFISHDKDITKNMEKVGTKADLDKTASRIIQGYSDFVFKLSRAEIDGRRTVIAETDVEGAESKSRARYFAPKFEFTYASLEKEMARAIEKQVNMEGIETKVQNLLPAEKRPYEEVFNSIKTMITHYYNIESPKIPEIEQVVNVQLGGQKFSQINENYYGNLLVIETYLLGLEEEE